MTVSFQRLLVIVISLIFLAFSILLILFNSKKNIVFFYTPSELLISDKKINDKIRLGGMVEKDSISNLGNNKYNFVITDNKNSLEVTYIGILPDLFRENQGAVIDGIIMKDDKIHASKVFAKHDENYMPASIKEQLKQNNFWKKKY